jgi:hypothetical protein
MTARCPDTRRHLRDATLAVALLALCACPPRPPVEPKLRADPALLLDEVVAAQKATERVEGTARVKIESPDVKGTVNAFLAAERPARLHVELLDFFGNPAAVLVADGDRFGYYDARRRTWYEGDATAENVSRFLPVALPPWELATILLGSAPVLEGEAADVVDRRGAVDLVVRGGDLVQTLGVGEALAVESSRVRAAGDANGPSPRYDLSFERFTRAGGVRFPNEVRLDAPRARASVRVSWKPDVEVNGQARPELFALHPPQGAKVVELPPGGAIPDVDLPLGAEE